MRVLALIAASIVIAPALAQTSIQWGNDPNQPQGTFGRPTQQQPPSSSATVKPAAASPVAEPPWPQRFEISSGGRAGFGFIVGQPGRIVVNMQSQGGPLVVSLIKPGGATLDKQGTGNVTVEYNATADDVKRGVIWGISVRGAQDRTPARAAVHDKPVKIDVQRVASGTIGVQHPAADMKRAQAELDARSKELGSKPTERTSRPASDIAAERQAALQKEQAARHAALLDQVKDRIPAEAHRKVSAMIASRAQAKVVAAGSLGIAAAPTAARSSSFAAPATSSTTYADTGTGAAGAPSTGATPVGGNQPAAVAASPMIASLSTSEGDPFAPVLVTGKAFTGTPGQVHFIVAPGKDLIADPATTTWTDTQIFTVVPDISGVREFSGQMYVQRGTQKSNLVPFRFKPTLETRTIWVNRDDRRITGPQDDTMGAGTIYYKFFGLLGGKGDDEFYRAKQLINGWLVDRVEVRTLSLDGRSDAYLVESRAGTASPYVKVHWWSDLMTSVVYTPQIIIVGPKGLPHE